MSSADDTKARMLAKANPAFQTSLQRENIPDPMDAEQTFPTDEEIALARDGKIQLFMLYFLKFI